MPSRTATFNSLSAVGVYIDAFAGDLHQDDVPKYRRFPQESIEAAVREMEAVKLSNDYTVQRQGCSFGEPQREGVRVAEAPAG